MLMAERRRGCDGGFRDAMKTAECQRAHECRRERVTGERDRNPTNDGRDGGDEEKRRRGRKLGLSRSAHVPRGAEEGFRVESHFGNWGGWGGK
jgi:hypothetical protein